MKGFNINVQGDSKNNKIVGAADKWKEGEPEESGRYLVEYQQGRTKKVFVMDYDAFEGRWLTHSTEAEVLRYAKINSDYA